MHFTPRVPRVKRTVSGNAGRDYLLCTVVIAWVTPLFAGQLLAQQANDLSSADTQILREIRDHNELMPNLEYLSDVIGPRLTGSPQQLAASRWAEQKFRDYGLTNVHQEKWVVNRAWQRGTAEAEVLAPVARRLAIASLGWSPGTNGRVEGPVAYVDANSRSELERYSGKLSGAAVILEPPRTVESPYAVAHSPITFPLTEPVEPQAKARDNTGSFYEFRTRFFKEQGVLAVLRDSANPYNLMRMSNGSAGDYEPGLLPVAYLAHEDYALIWRLLKRAPVRIELAIANAFSPGPVETSNTVAEIRGSEKPGEIVMLGAHLDSWDLASGSTDDGTGVVSVLEAARALAKLNLKPKRTLRFVLFTGEEQGEIGAHRYVTAHRDELPSISAILVNDTGTSRVVTIGIHENYPDLEATLRILAPLSGPLRLLEPKISRTFGSDYAAFNEVGVPGFSCMGDWPEYAETEHTQSDTFDKVSEDGITQAAQLMAGWAFNTAQYPTLLERVPKK
jgi:hypothetical protein